MAGLRVEYNAEPIPGYRLIERLGGGGFGEVWRAEAPGGLHKAIKFVYGDLSSTGDNDQRAKQELKALERVRSVRHPYILSLERYEIVDGRLLIVMELADRNLWDRYKECRAQGLPGIPRDELLRYMDETAEALDLMNQEYQLQHLDIKPQNLFLIHNHIKVADFGLVKDLEGSQASVTGGVTPVYAAPETFDGKVSRFSDQYSLGIVYQELLTGQRPFSGTNVRQLIMQHISATPNVSSLPGPDQPAISRALSKTPDERYPTCTDLVKVLRSGSVTGQAPLPPTGVPGQPGSGFPTMVNSSFAVPASWQGAVTPPPSSGMITANVRQLTPDIPSDGTTHCLRPTDQGILQAKCEPASFRALPEQTGNGTLFPTLIVALGNVGLTVMQKVRENLNSFVAPLTQLGHTHFLLIDTDPDVMRVATRGNGGAGLSAGEVLLTPLNRPSHYLKPRDGRLPLDKWLNPRMLYRIPRSQVTTGVRALGRLAFCDNYRVILRRLQLEIETILDPQKLNAAVRQTGLGLRTNRPRVYILTSLGGGTGSGMFLDVAYTFRFLLRQMGYETPDIVGLLMVPPVDGNRTKLISLGNAYAALKELKYYGSPGTTFQGKYHEQESPIVDTSAPFTRTIVQVLPEETDEVAMQEFVELCGQWLYRDMTTPLGKSADLARAELPGPPWESRGEYFQTFNLYQLTYPRHAVLQALSRRLCQRIVQRWNSKDSKPLREQVQEWVQEKWTFLELGADSFIHRIQAELVKALGRPPESLFSDIAGAIPQDGPTDPLNKSRVRQEPRSLDPTVLAPLLQKLEELIGRPTDDAPPESQPQLVGLLRTSAERLGNVWSQRLAEMSVQLIEEPSFRLAGAEEAIRQFVVTIEQSLQHHEPLLRDLSEKAASVWERLQSLAKPRAGTRKTTLSTAEIAELVRAYPKWRYQTLVLQHLVSVFVGLRGHLSDELREVNFCRVRLTELLRLFDETLPGEIPTGSAQGFHRQEFSIGRRLYLSGCKDLTETVHLLLEGVKPENLLELDTRIEAMLRKHFQALVHVCLTSTTNILRDVQMAMVNVAREYACELMPTTSVGTLFFDQQQTLEAAETELAKCFDEAAPEISQSRSGRSGPPQVDMAVVATPDDPDSVRLLEILQKTLPNMEVVEAHSTDDIIIYRERSNLALNELEHFGGMGHDAYTQMTATDNFTPHTRSDVDFRSQ